MDVPTTDRAHATRATQELDESNDGGGPGTLRSSPAHAMPAYQQNAAPTPLPEFPTLGPPIVWSFPATPMPASQPQPPVVMPSLPKTGKKHLPPPCGGGFRHPEFPPSVPFVAAEPAVSPGESEAPEMAPEPVAGGPVLPPFK
ncbi:hypothetical protein KP509_20G053100 [Ceratopteris richardii]|nr:hypothetical protein KP509_20G053100 [Ceratopteris richardii]